MNELLTPLRLMAYGTAAVVGLQLAGVGLSRLSGLTVGLKGCVPRIGRGAAPRAVVAGLAFLCAGLVLLAQGIVVVAQTVT
jgi:hypothetical protein